MRKYTLLVVLISLVQFGFAPEPHSAADPRAPEFRKVQQRAFHTGEYLKFNLHYGLINAGIAELRVKGTTKKSGRDVFHIVGTGRSVGMFNWMYKVDDRYETFLDTESMMPWEFNRHVDEGGYIIDRHITFDHTEGKAISDGKTYTVPPYVQDIFSAFYYSRCMDVKDIEPGEFLEIETFLDHEIYTLRLKYLGLEVVKSEIGRVHCMVFRPYVQAGRVFKEADDMTIWVSSDANHIPVRLQSDLLIGSIKMDLLEARGLLHPLALVSD